MKLKKGFKIAIVFILLGGIASSFYTFNKCFFNKYPLAKEPITEPEEKRNGKEVIKDNVFQSEEKKEIPETPNTTNNLENRTRAKEVYYCVGNATLVGKECRTDLEMPVIEEVKIENNKLIIPIMTRNTFYASSGIDLSEFTDDEIKEMDRLFEELWEALCQIDEGTLNKRPVSDDIAYECFIPSEKKSSLHKCLDDSYTLIGNKCTKTTRVEAKKRLECPREYTLEGTNCVKKIN